MKMTWQLPLWIALGSVLLALGPSPGRAAEAKPDRWPPWEVGEKLVYKLFWPSGVSFGEAVVEASSVGEAVHLEVSVEAKLLQKNLNYSFSSATTQELCSLRFRQKIREGGRSWEESFEFDPNTRQVRRTRGNQTSVESVPECPRDPLALLYYFRQQLASGKSLDVGAFHLGGDFLVRIEALVPETVKLGVREWEADRFLVTYTGGGGKNALELWLRPGAARIPAGAKMQFPLAIFSAELQ